MEERRNSRGKKNINNKAAVIIIALVFIISVVDSLGISSALMIFPLIICVVVGISVYSGMKHEAPRKNPLTGDSEAGHLCQSHNGVPTRKPGTQAPDNERYRMTNRDARDKIEEINALYRAGIIDAQERAERLAEVR